MRIRPDIEIANLSDVGCQRTVNEDYFLFYEPQDDDEFLRRGRLLLITDGMGGHSGGAVASRLAAETVRDVFAHSPLEDARAILIDAFNASHRDILEMARSRSELFGMGTTCSAAILRSAQLTVGHIGDCRLYLIREGLAAALTADHTIAGELLKSGIISAAEARVHEDRNVLTAALGGDSPTVAADFSAEPIPLAPGDLLLMCSDGLHALVDEREMEFITRAADLTAAVRQLVDVAKARGGPDNITVQLLRIREAPP